MVVMGPSAPCIRHSVRFLLHNDVLELEKRAAFEKSPLEGFEKYLFLLELTHIWGPEIQIPTGTTTGADELMGFPFHWSFWMDAGGSPAGGNQFIDNGDGTFDVAPQSPSDMKYSMLDLYLLGLAGADEVPPFFLLENVEPPTGILDPFNKKLYSAKSFPYFGSEPFTVKATRRTVTIDEVVAENGPRSPAFGEAPTTLEVGIVLAVAAGTSQEDIDQAKSVFDPIASGMKDAFEQATGGRGHLDIVTALEEPTVDAGPSDAGSDAFVPEPDSGTAPPKAQGGSADGSSGCALAPLESGGAPTWLTALALLMALRRRRARGELADCVNQRTGG